MALSHNDLVTSIAQALEAVDGDYLAKIYNEVCSDNVVYLGDSLFEQQASPELRRETLEGIGYHFFKNGRPDQWSWSAITDEAGKWFPSKEAAVDHAWDDACEQARAILSMADGDWKNMTWADQAALLMSNLREG